MKDPYRVRRESALVFDEGFRISSLRSEWQVVVGFPSVG